MADLRSAPDSLPTDAMAMAGVGVAAVLAAWDTLPERVPAPSER